MGHDSGPVGHRADATSRLDPCPHPIVTNRFAVPGPSRFRTRVLGGALVLALVVPGPAGRVAAQDAVDVGRLMGDLSVLAHDSMQGRRIGTPGAAAARRMIRTRLESIGLDVVESTFEGRDGAQGVNLEVRIPGTDDALPEFVLTAHYDHLGVREGEVFNGTDDNASGVAAVLEIVRNVRRAPLRHTLVAVFFDGEEGGLRGARAWVDARTADGTIGDVGLNVNLDMVSRSEHELWVTGTHQYPELRPILDGVDPAAGVALRFGHDTPEDRGSDNWVMASDHGPFHAAGRPFLYFGVEDHPDYHRSTDDFDKVNPAWYGASVETILRAVRALDAEFPGR